MLTSALPLYTFTPLIGGGAACTGEFLDAKETGDSGEREGDLERDRDNDREDIGDRVGDLEP